MSKHGTLFAMTRAMAIGTRLEIDSAGDVTSSALHVASPTITARTPRRDRRSPVRRRARRAASEQRDDVVSTSLTVPALDSYATVVVAFSGGKDSLAFLLHLIEAGVPRERIELWHHDVDGREGSDLMDWPCTRAYCQTVADALGVRLYFSWKVGGFEREMLRDGVRTAPTRFEVLGGAVVEVGGVRGGSGTRRRFPQVSADLKVRWCSAYLKIDVGSTAIRNQERFRRARTLIVSGERAQESPARAKYQVFEPDRADGRTTRHERHVDRWRPVHGWTEKQVWAIIERHCINPHPAYRLGWGRVSCAACIFGGSAQWASLARLAPAKFERVATYEEQFGVTIQRKRSVRQLAVIGNPYAWDEADARAALSIAFDEPAILTPSTWRLPRGAYGESCGPS